MRNATPIDRAIFQAKGARARASQKNKNRSSIRKNGNYMIRYLGYDADQELHFGSYRGELMWGRSITTGKLVKGSTVLLQRGKGAIGTIKAMPC